MILVKTNVSGHINVPIRLLFAGVVEDLLGLSCVFAVAVLCDHSFGAWVHAQIAHGEAFYRVEVLMRGEN